MVSAGSALESEYDGIMCSSLQNRLAAVRQRIENALRRADRHDAVTLVAVTKTVTADVAAELFQLGVHDFGENRPQDLWRKQAVIPHANWHFIGHLQRNKIERTIPLVSQIHSIDSLRLLEAIEAFGSNVRGLLEVNCSREPNKGGFAPSELPILAEALATLKHVSVEGLMTMAAYHDNPEQSRSTFAELRNLREGLRSRTGLQLPHLSMGMSNDFEIAIEEGATIVRLGTILFGEPGA